MKTVKFTACIFFMALMVGCSPTQSLQEYYVDNSENPNFISLDLPVSLLNMEKADLTEAQKEGLASLRKLNVLAFKKTVDNQAEFLAEKTKVKSILSDNKFVELMKLNTGYGKATIKYLGDEDAIEEVVIYGDNDKKGFLLVRVLGKDMNPAKMMQFLQALEKSDYKGEGLDQLGDLFKG